ncbi:uncharacterized protein LOC120343358 [Styela clava]
MDKKRQKVRGSMVSITTQPDNEREKIIKLVQVWRSKYEKLYATSQDFDEIITKLKRENEQIRDEKETVSHQLQEKLTKEREAAEIKISELLTIADTAEKQNELETRDMKTKLQRLERDTQPIINMYKERVEKMQKHVEKTEETNAQLKSENENLLAKLQQTDVDKIDEISELKRSHRQKLVAMKIANAAKLQFLKKAAEQNLEEQAKQMNAEHENKLSISKNGNEHAENKGEPEHTMESIVTVGEKEIENIKKQYEQESKQLKRDVENIKAEKQRITDELKSELFKMKKRVELGRIKLQHKEQVIKDLKMTITDANTQLSSDRNRRNIIRKTTIPVKTLSRQLVVTIRETRSIERALKRIDSAREFHGYIDVDDELRLEILYTSKIAEINRLKRLIHDKLIEVVYQKPQQQSENNKLFKRQSQPVMMRESSFEDDEIVFLRSGYGSDTSSDMSFQDETLDEGSNPDRGRIEKIDIERREVIRYPVDRTDRTSWLLSPKHYSTTDIR